MRPRKGFRPPPGHRDPDNSTQIWVGSEPPKRIIYFSADARFRWWLSLAENDYVAPQHIAAMGHHGLPLDRDIQLLQLLREPAGAVVTVFGDLDPDDLLVYAALSAALNASSRKPVVEYSGVTSRMLTLAERTLGKRATDNVTHPLDRREAALMRYIRKNSLLDLERLVGAKAASILDSGRRISLDGIVPPLLTFAAARRTIISWVR